MTRHPLAATDNRRRTGAERHESIRFRAREPDALALRDLDGAFTRGCGQRIAPGPRPHRIEPDGSANGCAECIHGSCDVEKRTLSHCDRSFAGQRRHAGSGDRLNPSIAVDDAKHVGGGGVHGANGPVDRERFRRIEDERAELDLLLRNHVRVVARAVTLETEEKAPGCRDDGRW